VLVGPDGVGKTEVARELLRRCGGRYFHFRPPSRAGDLRDSPPTDGPPKKTHTGPFPLGPFRLLRNFILFWSGYLASVGPTLRSGDNVVGDRWAYGYLVQPTSLKFSGPYWLARFAIRALPEPDVVVNLVASPETVRRRKPELTLDEIRRELKAWRMLPVDRLVSVDAEPSVDLIVDRLVEQVLA
jgi:thymidylate kinase